MKQRASPCTSTGRTPPRHKRLLLAVAPQQTGHWAWTDLIEILNDTIDRAKLRAVEPDHIKSPYFQLLPPIVAAFDDSMLMATAKFLGSHGLEEVADRSQARCRLKSSKPSI